MVRCGAGAGLNIEGCGAVRAPALNDCAVRVRASSLRGGAVAGQTFRPAQGSSVEWEVGRWRCREGGRNGAWEVWRYGLGEDWERIGRGLGEGKQERG